MGIYLDHNATTPLRREARERWLEVHDELGGNPSSPHASGRRARDVVDRARETVAGALGVDEGEVIFTSGGTEANNLALAGTTGATRGKPGETALVTSATEHASVLAPLRVLADRGHPLVEVPVDGEGRVAVEAMVGAVKNHVRALVSVAWANSEVGSVAPVADLAAALAAQDESRVVLHTDAVQALGRLPVRPREAGCHLATFSAHKVGGPPGVGVLWRRKGTHLAPILRGGGQEMELRAGTEDAASIAAAAVAIDLAVRELETYRERTFRLATTLWTELARTLPAVRLLGPSINATDRLPNTLSILLPGMDGRTLVTRLDLDGLEVSAGSACASGSLEPSHVLLAMGFDERDARAALRLSLGRTNTLEECKGAVDILRKVVGASHAT